MPVCRRSGAALAAAIAAALAVAGCAARESGAGAHTLNVTAHDFAFDAPAETPAGLTTIRLVNKGPSLHHIQLIKLADGKTPEDFFAALKAGGPPPAWATDAGGPNPPEPGSTAEATTVLEPGTYLITCFVPGADGVPHIMKGMARPLKVTGAIPANQTEPAADETISLVDYSFQLAKPLTAGRHVIRVENHGTQSHELVLVRLAEGKSPKDFADWAFHQEGPAPGALYGGVSAIMPGTHQFASVDLPAGNYALICFVPDAKDGKPHLAHGMAMQITVS
ncbi:MAG TPA: hypothetical protein VFW66_11475 [Gemmatimonadales bacterium]|nr:hypothetical protein [Gemmatimonadales bacterium]